MACGRTHDPFLACRARLSSAHRHSSVPARSSTSPLWVSAAWLDDSYVVLLGGSFVVISGVISPPIWVISPLIWVYSFGYPT